MARFRTQVKYSYKSFPNCPQATQYSKDREANTASMSGGVILLTFFAVLLFIGFSFDLFNTYDWLDFFPVFFALAAAAVVDFRFFICRRRETKCELKILLAKYGNTAMPEENIASFSASLREENRKGNIYIAKIYFATFVFLVLAVLSLIGLIKGISFFCHNQAGLSLLIGSCISLCIFGCLSWYLIHRWPSDDDVDLRIASTQKKRTK